MENKEYNRLIYSGKLNELADIWNISDLTRYIYLHKYLLEFLLEKDIHTTRMDNYVCNDIEWIKLYIKYDIIKPLLNLPLEKLLLIDNNELILETLIKKLNLENRIELYNNLKKNSYWLLRKNETLIKKIYLKYNIELPELFIKLPSLYDNNLPVNEKFESLIKEFRKTFSDTSDIILDIYVNEFIRKSKINMKRACIDINKLIEYKKRYKAFNLAINEFLDEEEIYTGEYDSVKKRIVINKEHHDTFAHELSHMFYDELENPSDALNVIYKTIQDKLTSQKTIDRIVDYLKEFHERYNSMKLLFRELYYHEIYRRFGNFNNYCNKIYYDIIDNELETIVLDNNDTTIYIDDDHLEEVVIELLSDECNEYVKTLIHNYYSEELMLENLLDAFLKGNIFDDKYDVVCLSGHSRKSFKKEKNLSFNEVLADFDAIKNSSKANILINKLRELIGDELVDYLEDYLNKNRNKVLKK